MQHMLPVILVIEDDVELQTYLKDLLRENDYVTEVAPTGAAGLAALQTQTPNLVLLDLTLPDMTGEGICLEIRHKYPQVPIIILTAKDAVTDKVKGLESGADDYVTKPFVPQELLARIKARLRHRGEGDQSVLQIGDLTLNTKTLEVFRGKQLINLTPQEFKLLHYLMSNAGNVLTREMILNRIWLYSPDVETRVVDVYMGYLRKKIDAGHSVKLLHSIRGFGYTIKE